MTRLRAFAVAAAALSAFAHPAAAGPLKLDAAKPVTLTCQTQAIVVKDNGPAPTKGKVELRLELKSASPEAKVPEGQSAVSNAPEAKTPDSKPESKSVEAAGSWSPVSADEAHKGAFADTLKTACAPGCPMTVSASGDAQLWAPAPKALDKLGPEEALLLAVIKADTLSLKASSFRGPSIEALESGMCTIAPQVTP